MNSTVIIVIGSIIVAFIFITWLVRYISGLQKTRDFYQKKISEMKHGDPSGEAEETADAISVPDEEQAEND